ncbi:ribosomal protein L17 [Myxozyma melibiosi]|uniref:Ribosomal protein L17 n=1 Tax=Myxozyma melibiosi TaxID=54550 RepID=A0ABR1F4W5_9ASCO
MPSQGQAHRTLGRPSGHRRALLRNLVTSLIEHESITTTYARAKEAQPLLEKMITAAKINTNATRARMYSFVFSPKLSIDRLVNEFAPRYADRTGGYTRLLHLEPRAKDSAPMAVLEMVGGPKDLRLYMTAKAIARAETKGVPFEDKPTKLNYQKITENMPNGAQVLREKVELMKKIYFSNTPAKKAELEEKRRASLKGQMVGKQRAFERSLKQADPKFRAERAQERKRAELRKARREEAERNREINLKKKAELEEYVKLAPQRRAERRRKWLEYVLREEGHEAWLEKSKWT